MKLRLGCAIWSDCDLLLRAVHLEVVLLAGSDRYNIRIMILNSTACNNNRPTLLDQNVVERAVLLPCVGLILELVAELSLMKR